MIRRSTGLLAFLIALLSLPAAATNYTGSGNATVMSLGSPSANCVGWPSCPTVLNSAAAPLYTLDPTVNSSIQSLLTALQAPLTFNLPTGASTSALQTTGNGFLSTLVTASASQATGAKQDTGNTSLATIANAQGAQGTGSTFNPPAGGSGILGYLSGIYKAITGTLTVSGTVTSAPAQISLQNLDVTSLSGSAASTILATGHAGHGGWVSSTVAYCLNLTGTAGTVNNTPAGTSCFTANYIFVLPAMSGAVSMYGLSAGASYGQGSL